MGSSLLSWWGGLPLRVWAVLCWFVVFLVLTIMVSTWFLVALFLPVYWQLYWKRDVAPKWW